MSASVFFDTRCTHTCTPVHCTLKVDVEYSDYIYPHPLLHVLNHVHSCKEDVDLIRQTPPTHTPHYCTPAPELTSAESLWLDQADFRSKAILVFNPKLLHVPLYSHSAKGGNEGCGSVSDT